jgi:hypothetical protein
VILASLRPAKLQLDGTLSVFPSAKYCTRISISGLKKGDGEKGNISRFETSNIDKALLSLLFCCWECRLCNHNQPCMHIRYIYHDPAGVDM